VTECVTCHVVSRSVLCETGSADVTQDRQTADQQQLLLHSSYFALQKTGVGYCITLLSAASRLQLGASINRSRQHWRCAAAELRPRFSN